MIQNTFLCKCILIPSQGSIVQNIINMCLIYKDLIYVVIIYPQILHQVTLQTRYEDFLFPICRH